MFYLMGFLWINMTFFLNIWYFECLVTQISQFQHSKTGFWATWVLGWWLISASIISILGKILVILHYICWVCFSPVTSFCLKNVLGFSVYLSLIKIPLLLLILQTLNMIINTHLRQGKRQNQYHYWKIQQSVFAYLFVEPDWYIGWPLILLLLAVFHHPLLFKLLHCSAAGMSPNICE